MDHQELAVLRVLAEADAALSAREIAARLHGLSVAEAVATGLSVEASRVCARLARIGRWWVSKDYPYRCTYAAYLITGAGEAALALHDLRDQGSNGTSRRRITTSM